MRGDIPTTIRVKPSLWRRIRSKGAVGTVRAVIARVAPPRVQNHPKLLEHFVGRRGLEIGGPSPAFGRRGIFPVYPLVETLDSVNFAAVTVWEGAISEGGTYRFDARRAPGRQFILEATDLGRIASEQYDFVLSSHTIEHTANPLRALAEWRRVMKRGGHMALVVPDKVRTFDHLRPVTRMDHLLQDLEKDTGEEDLTHVAETEQLHDPRRDPGDVRAEVSLAEHNLYTRVMHHHVFDEQLVREVVLWGGFELVWLELVAPVHVFALARRPAELEVQPRQAS